MVQQMKENFVRLEGAARSSGVDLCKVVQQDFIKKLQNQGCEIVPGRTTIQWKRIYENNESSMIL